MLLAGRSVGSTLKNESDGELTMAMTLGEVVKEIPSVAPRPVRKPSHEAFQSDCSDRAACQRESTLQHDMRDVQHLGAQVAA